MADGWVCPECGLDYDTVSPPDAEIALRSFPRRYGEQLGAVLERDDGEALVRTRPDAQTWSAVEYTAHVADLMGEFALTFAAMVQETNPELDFWDQDARATEQHYNDWSVEDLKARLHQGCDAAADAVAKTKPADWDRTARFSWGERDLLTMIRNAVHEGSHHLRDVEKVLAAVT
jgi:hypothetical protein